MEKTKVLAICGRAGSGKDTLARELVYLYPELFHSIVSYTTRPKREKEKEGIDYFFLNDLQFESFIRSKDCLEYTKFNDWYYGTSLRELTRDKVNVGVFNLQGIETLLSNSALDVTMIYLRTGAKTRLLRQLNREEDPNVDEIVRRYIADEEDFKDKRFFLLPTMIYTLDNNNVEDLQRNLLIIKELFK